MNNFSKVKYPLIGVTYTLEQMYQMNLGDLPCLQIRDVGVVQDSHLTEEELLSIPGMKDTHWLFVRTTSELIPVFIYALNNPPYTDFFDAVPYKDPYQSTTDLLWVTPKGYPRTQE
jgi:hypothetical protein